MSGFTHVVTASLAVVVAVVLAGGAQAPALGAPASNPDRSDRPHVVQVYYFHTTARCSSCRKIEALSESIIRGSFERELGDGSVEWAPVNIDEPANRHFIEDYALYTKSLVVVDRMNGQQVRWKNLPKIWELLRDEVAFRQYIQREVRVYLDKRS